MIKQACLALTLSAVGFLSTAQLAVAQSNEVTFDLIPNPQFVSCIANPYSYDPPHAKVTIERGALNDLLILQAYNIKPNLGFDLFTIQNSPFLANGSADPNFKNFGLAWYQSDVQADANGRADVVVKTILLDQIFGFDPAVSLAPTNTFHVGFWFNNPQDAAACGFDPSKPTPVNGEHKAGPLAMISVPASSGLGPLCTNPDTSKNPPTCNP
jgi:hypothetical protein